MEMIPLEYVIAFAMALVNLFKHKLPVAVVPISSFLLAIALHVCNAMLFGGDPMIAIKDAFVEAGIIIGLFTGGTMVRKVSQANNPLQR